MKKFFILPAVAILLFVTNSNVHADEMDNVRPYMGIGVGSFSFDYGGSFGKARSIGYFLKVGADFKKYFGIELRGGATNKAKKTILGISTQATLDRFLSAAIKLQIPLSKLNIYALGGGTIGKVSVSAISPISGLSLSAQGTGSSASYGGGIEFGPINNVSVGAEWFRYYKDITSISGSIKFSY